MADLISRLAQELGIRPQQAESAVRLLDEGKKRKEEVDG